MFRIIFSSKKLLYFFILLNFNLNAQNTREINPIDFQNFAFSARSLGNGATFFIKKNNLKNKVEGSPYINQKWINGLIYMQNGKTYKVKKLNYNAYKHNLEVLISKDSTFIFNSSTLTKFKIGDKIFIKINGDKKYYRIVYQDKRLKLLKSYDVKIIKSNYVPGIEAEKNADKLSIVESYFLDVNNKLSKTKLKKKNIIPLLKNRDKTLQFVRNNKLSFRKESHIISILKYDYNN